MCAQQDYWYATGTPEGVRSRRRPLGLSVAMPSDVKGREQRFSACSRPSPPRYDDTIWERSAAPNQTLHLRGGRGGGAAHKGLYISHPFRPPYPSWSSDWYAAAETDLITFNAFLAA